MSTPRISILIPNFNNGRESSIEGRHDFIQELFESLVATLEDDPTPVEIIVQDDGSTDDSLASCRRWADRTWRGGQPFCEFIETPHCGVLSIVANNLTRRAKGEFCVRLDGDVVCLTPRWAEALCRIFDEGPPEVGVIGPKQLGVDGRIHAMGDWILHPRGCHHIAQGADRRAVTRTIEVDHVMGCFYCHRRKIWEEVGGYDESFLRGQTVDFGMMSRLKGWRTIATPTIEFTHNHKYCVMRATTADTNAGIWASLDTFRDKWGFDRLAPDLDLVAAKYAGTSLLWNARVFGPAEHWPPMSNAALDINGTEWGVFAQDDAQKVAVDARLRVVAEMNRLLPARRRVLQVQSRAGLFCHLMAKKGITCLGVDPDEHCVELATQIAADETYPGPPPEFHVQPDRTKIPLADASVDTVLLFDVVERHHNPVGLFKEAHRVLEAGGVLAVVTPERPGPFDADGDCLHAYRTPELKLQLEGTRGFVHFGNAKPATAQGLIIMLALRREMRFSESESTTQREEVSVGA